MIAADDDVRALHRALLQAWNDKDARAFAALFAADADCIGFDGSEMRGAETIQASLARIFADHPTARYVGKVRSVRTIADGVAVLHAVVGMVPRGKRELNPAVNAVQLLVAVAGASGRWQIASLQNTPAAYHGRPEAAAALTAELQPLVATLPPE